MVTAGVSTWRGPCLCPSDGAREFFMARVAVLLVMLLAGACATAGHEVAMEGRRVIVGMDAESLQACAGVPARTKRLDLRTEIFSYELKNENVGGMSFSLPLVGGGFKIAGSGSY